MEEVHREHGAEQHDEAGELPVDARGIPMQRGDAGAEHGDHIGRGDDVLHHRLGDRFDFLAHEGVTLLEAHYRKSRA